MITYRDMTVCAHWRDCKKAPGCRRPLTDEVKGDAEKWWGRPDVPICQFVDRPSCHSEGDNKDAHNG